VIEALAITALTSAPKRHHTSSKWICIIGPALPRQSALRHPPAQSERFYEWAVEGMLFLPAVAVLMGELL